LEKQWLNQQKSYSEPELFYWNRAKSGSTSELDYLFQIGGVILSVEVKSGTTGSLKSLHVFVSEKKSPLAFRFNQDRPSWLRSKQKYLKRRDMSFNS
jgi:Holliday junction resolvase-like predicted endonuclease